MALETITPRSRRALLTAGLGGLAAFVAGAVGRPAPTRATDGDAVLVGGSYTASTVTKLTNSTDNDTVFEAESTTSGTAVRGSSSSYIGVWGSSHSSRGVFGESDEGIGVSASSTSGIAIKGTSAAPAYPAAIGQSTGNSTGLLGASGGPLDPLPTARANTGVFGYAAADPLARGVWGETASGVGVVGTSTSNVGVWGSSASEAGVLGSSDSNAGVRGTSNSSYGVRGLSGSSYAVRGTSTSGIGVGGSSTSSYGVDSENFAPDKPAIRGRASDNTGVFGFSGGAVPAAPAKTGVYGYAVQDVGSRGVWGRSNAGLGVFGQATTGSGLYGLATTGYALRTNGRLRLEKSSGTAVVAAGTNSKTVTPGVDLTATSTVLATLQGSAGGTTTVHRVAINAVADTFTIYLTANATVNVKVGWILLS
jgi:hypothetical protein